MNRDARSPTDRLKGELWRRFGSDEYPAEWDGKVYGGGKLSQRFWEYFKAIEFLELQTDSVVLDIGGGSPVTGLGFFSSLIATSAKQIIVMDPNVSNEHSLPRNVQVLRESSGYQSLSAAFERFPELSHVTSISVFEHIPPDVRVGIMRAINENFPGDRFVLTLEFHPTRCYFEHQLTERSLSDLVMPLTSFYPAAYEASPVHGATAVTDMRQGFRGRAKRLVSRVTGAVPRWYPLALAFQRRVAQ